MNTALTFMLDYQRFERNPDLQEVIDTARTSIHVARVMDRQRFERNPELDRVIGDAHRRRNVELSLDELSFAAAAMQQPLPAPRRPWEKALGVAADKPMKLL